jgi:prenyltransferase beta subunit
MTRAAAAAPALLLDGGASTAEFLLGGLAPDGGFRGPGGRSDLYYAVFALSGLDALGAEIPREAVAGWLDVFGDGAGLDLVHLASLIRCLACLGLPGEGELSAALLARVEGFRSSDGGYAPAAGVERGTCYASFLALAAREDLGAAADRPDELAAFVESLRSFDGGFANSAEIPLSTVPTTAAAAVTLRRLGRPAGEPAARWLIGCARPQGGFAAHPLAPEADLLSTAVALHALGAMEFPHPDENRQAVSFVQRCRRGDGGFAAGPGAGPADSEHTFYGLLALGHSAQAGGKGSASGL